MDKELFEELGMQWETIVLYKKIMEFLCNKCDLECNKDIKLKCVDFSLTLASRIVNEIREKIKDGYH